MGSWSRTGSGLGAVPSTDVAPEMLVAARRRAAGVGLENAEFRVMDAQKLDLADESVDGVLCRWGYMLVEEPARAFAETRRVLGPEATSHSPSGRARSRTNGHR